MKFTTVAAVSSMALAAQAADHDPRALFQYSSSMTEILTKTSKMAQRNNITTKDVASKFICPVAGEVAKTVQDALDGLGSDSPDGQTKGQMNRLIGDGKSLSSAVGSNSDLKCSELDDLSDAISKVQSKLGNNKRRSVHKRDHDDRDSDNDNDTDSDDDDSDDDDSDDDDDDMFDNTTAGVLSYGTYRGLNIVKNAGEQTAHDSGVTASKIQSSFTCPMTGEMASTIKQIDLDGNNNKDQLSKKVSGAATAVENTPSLGCDDEVKQLKSAVSGLGSSSASSSTQSSSGASSASSASSASGGKSPKTTLETSTRTASASNASSSSESASGSSARATTTESSSSSASSSASAAAETSGDENGASIVSPKGALLAIPAAALLLL